MTETNPNLITKVTICFFKPSGYEDTHYVDTNDRGKALNTVISRYPKEMKFVNYVSSDHVDRNHIPKRFLDRILPASGSVQDSVKAWTTECFGPEIAKDPVERNQRFLEEAVELVQSLGATESECQDIVSYVFGRDKGEPRQEVGGVTITLASLCNVHGIDVQAEELNELARINTPEMKEKIRTKNLTKPRFGRQSVRIVSAADGPNSPSI